MPFGFVRVSDTSSAAALCRVRTSLRFRGTLFVPFVNRRECIVTAPSVPAKEQTRPVRRRDAPFRGHSFHRFHDATCVIATRLAERPILVGRRQHFGLVALSADCYRAEYSIYRLLYLGKTSKFSPFHVRLAESRRPYPHGKPDKQGEAVGSYAVVQVLKKTKCNCTPRLDTDTARIPPHFHLPPLAASSALQIMGCLLTCHRNSFEQFLGTPGLLSQRKFSGKRKASLLGSSPK